MKKILYVDLISPIGHISFNSNYINELEQLKECEVDCVFRKGYSEKLRIETSVLKTIPNCFYSNKINHPLLNRVLMFLSLLYFKLLIPYHRYDTVIFSSYDEIVYSFFRFRKSVFINHMNASGIYNKLKLFCLKKISKHNKMLVFNEAIKSAFIEKEISNVHVVQHGLPIPFKKDNSIFNKQIPQHVYSSKYIFSPSSNSIDEKFISDLLQDKSFQDLLITNNLYFLVKASKNHQFIPSERCLIITDYLTDEEYETLFMKSYAILLPYHYDFNLRVSNVLFESIVNNKLCFVRNIDTLYVYRDNINYNCFFDTVDNLIQLLSFELTANDTDKQNRILYVNLERLQVSFNFLLSDGK